MRTMTNIWKRRNSMSTKMTRDLTLMAHLKVSAQTTIILRKELLIPTSESNFTFIELIYLALTQMSSNKRKWMTVTLRKLYKKENSFTSFLRITRINHLIRIVLSIYHPFILFIIFIVKMPVPNRKLEIKEDSL